MMTAKERLLLLATKLMENANDPTGMKFDLVDWVKESDGSPARNCGTTGCAIGLACITPEFIQEGFTLSDDLEDPFPIFMGEAGWAAVQSYFLLTEREAYYLFIDDRYPPHLRKGAEAERAVAARIRNLVAENYEVNPE